MTCAKISVVSKRFQLRSGPVKNSQPATAMRSDSSTVNTNAKNISPDERLRKLLLDGCAE